MFALTQWMTLGAVIAIPQAVGYLCGLGAGALVDRETRRYREIEKVFESGEHDVRTE